MKDMRVRDAKRGKEDQGDELLVFSVWPYTLAVLCDFLYVRVALRGVIPHFMGWVCMCGVLQVVSPE